MYEESKCVVIFQPCFKPIWEKGEERGNMLLLNINRKSYVESQARQKILLRVTL